MLWYPCLPQSLKEVEKKYHVEARAAAGSSGPPREIWGWLERCSGHLAEGPPDFSGSGSGNWAPCTPAPRISVFLYGLLQLEDGACLKTKSLYSWPPGGSKSSLSLKVLSSHQEKIVFFCPSCSICVCVCDASPNVHACVCVCVGVCTHAREAWGGPQVFWR